MKVLPLVAVVLVLAGCGAPTAKPTTAKPTGDDGAFVSCQHFRDVMGDISKGILTPAEIRVKLKEVNDNASVSVNPGVAENALGMLAASTADDGTAFLTSSVAFSKACQVVGL